MGGVTSKTLTRKDFLNLVEKRNAVKIINEEHQEIINMEVSGNLIVPAFTTANLQDSQPEKEELCFKHSCVTLSNIRMSCVPINASYIDGFEGPQAYIVTRTPDSETTTCNFWRMICLHQTEVVVMLDQPGENRVGTSFLDPDEESLLQFGKLSIKRFKPHQIHSSFVIMRAVVTHEDGGTLDVNYFLFKNWQRQDVSPLECELLNLISMTRLYNKSAVTPESLKGYKSPIVVHCSDGLQRSMVFCAIDISISTFKETDKVNLYSIVSQLRKDRYNCLYDANDYSLCYLALEYYFKFYV